MFYHAEGVSLTSFREATERNVCALLAGTSECLIICEYLHLSAEKY